MDCSPQNHSQNDFYFDVSSSEPKGRSVFVHVIKVNGVQNNPNGPHCLTMHSNGFEII